MNTHKFLCSLIRCLGILVLVTSNPLVGAVLMTSGEMLLWLELDSDEEPCSYHGKPPLTVKELKKNER